MSPQSIIQNPSLLAPGSLSLEISKRRKNHESKIQRSHIAHLALVVQSNENEKKCTQAPGFQLDVVAIFFNF